MIYSSLYGIKKDYTGEIISNYQNAWLFSPVIWEILSDKVLPKDAYGKWQSFFSFNGNNVLREINKIMNNSKNMADRICWEVSNQSIFYIKDKHFISEKIKEFLATNNNYCKSEDDNIPALLIEHIVERFNTIANDINNLDESKYLFFVFKNKSSDNNVEKWFYKYNEKGEPYFSCPITENLNNFYAEFIVIKNGEIVKFVTNNGFVFKELLVNLER